MPVTPTGGKVTAANVVYSAISTDKSWPFLPIRAGRDAQSFAELSFKSTRK